MLRLVLCVMCDVDIEESELQLSKRFLCYFDMQSDTGQSEVDNVEKSR